MRKLLKSLALTVVVFSSVFIFFPADSSAGNPQNILIIGWDGADREAVKNMLAARQLPHLSALIKEGRLVEIDITSGATDTKAGWAQIFTGYSPDVTGVYSNIHYQPIPAGFTIFERARKTAGGDRLYTAIIAGKSVNIDNDYPRKISYELWKQQTEKKGIRELFSLKSHIEKNGVRIIEEGQNKFVILPGKVYLRTQKGLNNFTNGLGDNEKTAKYAMEVIARHADSRLLLAVIFVEPDNSGHKSGEGSEDYKNGIRLCDEWTGAIIGRLKEIGIYEKTLIYVVSDHGFDSGRRTHNKAPRVFCATNDKLVKRHGDRADIAPTILKRLGIDLSKIEPPLTGKPLDDTATEAKSLKKF